ncbi:hypothetical protein RB25_05490 [Herbaspirillum rubrisubalbicans]|uniref:Uncharacterized protein n=2 Tax=Herbaspirillum rubrisubalbicans TaxID=80842 RepID=A0ABX9C1K1_9BURK|nr:hypothetical protein [Herbaspirillum rubrisubalbicans]QJQ00254.1 hypothetical protein C798_08430 [Herbaspirillum rubrisubalbicans Os34]RAM64282.1 hypothetical protein RB24_13060 [Herbaspirillum rubrisubalbicans]RAN49828.1 hypothetical protein RB25_05490 [Herbaspirillum rubrisubalbicans]
MPHVMHQPENADLRDNHPLEDQDPAHRPQQGPTQTHYAPEPAGHEGTLGGQPPLNAPAGIQRLGRGGVLVEKSPNGAEDESSAVRHEQRK